jgi:hypothetical protein
MAVSVDDCEAVVAVAGHCQDSGVAAVPAAVREDFLLGEAGIVRLLGDLVLLGFAGPLVGLTGAEQGWHCGRGRPGR